MEAQRTAQGRPKAANGKPKAARRLAQGAPIVARRPWWGSGRVTQEPLETHKKRMSVFLEEIDRFRRAPEAAKTENGKPTRRQAYYCEKVAFRRDGLGGTDNYR